jgi:predicted metalloprotease with PDZ domain
MLDVLIAKHSGKKHSLQTVLKNLYDNFYKKNKGYTEQDFTDLCSAAAGKDLQNFFDKYVYGLEPYEPLLKECFETIGLFLEKHHASAFYERYLGLKAVEHLHHKKITMIAPYSPAWNAGLSINDDILAVNGYVLKNDFNQWLTYFSHKAESVALTVQRGGEIKEITIPLKQEGDFFYTYKIKHREDLNSEEIANFEFWKKSFQK